MQFCSFSIFYFYIKLNRKLYKLVINYYQWEIDMKPQKGKYTTCAVGEEDDGYQEM